VLKLALALELTTLISSPLSLPTKHKYTILILIASWVISIVLALGQRKNSSETKAPRETTCIVNQLSLLSSSSSLKNTANKCYSMGDHKRGGRSMRTAAQAMPPPVKTTTTTPTTASTPPTTRRTAAPQPPTTTTAPLRSSSRWPPTPRASPHSCSRRTTWMRCARNRGTQFGYSGWPGILELCLIHSMWRVLLWNTCSNRQ
jgi:hypothetical protein